MSSNLIRRAVVAVVAIPTAIGVVYVGGWALTGLLAVLAALGSAELYRLADLSGIRPVEEVGYVAAALLPVGVFAATSDGLYLGYRYLVLAAAVYVITVMAIAVWRRNPEDRPLSSVAVTILGVVYAGGMPAFLIILRHPPGPLTAWGATWLVFLPLAVVWICDSMAMAGGSAIGGPKLAAVVSPNKTWAGFITGSVAAGIVAPIYGVVLLERFDISLHAWQLVVFGVIVATVGQVGDLAESLFKREVGVKDSGTAFPGHGGVLDRLDSLYWAIPVAVILLILYDVI
ncbi:MAG: phosphatidate cytidylyltransferase [Gemmatimonadales bacterium]